ncbi:MAG TPA: lycopene cyclase family protein [Acetobacteraceae bacterium]
MAPRHPAHDLPSPPEYDIAILGAGLAGLSLAVRLAAPRFARLRVLVVEQRTGYRRDRTWSGWTLRPHPFAAAVTGRWDRWSVASGARQVVLASPGLHYESIAADAFYRLALQRIRAAPQIELLLGVHAEARDGQDAATVTLPDRVVRAGAAFDTRPSPGIGRHGLTQAFLGQEIRTDRPVFDPGNAMLMDFRPPQPGAGPARASHFTYVLPSSPTQALVEDTWFSPPGFQPPDHRSAIRAHMAARHGADRYEVLFEEEGALPMDPVFQPRPGHRLLPLGTAGGATRPSTGYAFNAIQARCDEIVADLDAGRRPSPARPRPAAIRMMDRVLLHLLERRPDLAPHVFTTLFARCPPAALVRFMNDAAGPADLVAVAAAIPFLPTVGAALRLAAGGMEWPRPVAAG